MLFHLLDGSYIKSLPGNHHRLENGYQIKGEIVRDGIILKNYAGVVNDNEIERITVEGFNVIGTIALVGSAVGFYIVTVSVSNFLNQHRPYSPASASGYQFT